MPAALRRTRARTDIVAQQLRGILSPARIGDHSVKDTKTKKELALLVAHAIEAVVSAVRVMPPFIEGHIRDGMGRNWDVSMPAPTPVHRKAIDSVRDLYDLA